MCHLAMLDDFLLFGETCGFDITKLNLSRCFEHFILLGGKMACRYFISYKDQNTQLLNSLYKIKIQSMIKIIEEAIKKEIIIDQN